MFGIQIATVFEQCHFRMAAQVKIKNMAFAKKKHYLNFVLK